MAFGGVILLPFVPNSISVLYGCLHILYKL
jgi:hypothetical protein